MNVISGQFFTEMELPQNDEDGKLAVKQINERLKAAANILKATSGIEIDFEWEEIQ